MSTKRNNRDDFPQPIIDALAKRASYICSNPDCRSLTLAPSDVADNKYIYNGTAAHITSASKGGPRYNEDLTSQERKSIDNGIFLCTSCANIIDKNKGIDFSVQLLKRWKNDHEIWVRQNLNKSVDALIKNPKSPLLNVQFEDGQDTLNVELGDIQFTGETEEDIAREKLALNTIRIDLALSNTGESPSHDIDIFLEFPANTLIYDRDRFKRKWELVPYNVLDDPEYLRLALGRKHKTGMKQIAEAIQFDFFEWKIPPKNSRLSSQKRDTVPVLKLEGNKVRFHLDKLKQQITEYISPLYVQFQTQENIVTTDIKYVINADEMPVNKVGELKVVITFISND